MKDLSIYVHIPFCKMKCYYCDFLSFSGLDSQLISDYFNALYIEIKNRAESIADEYNVRTVFFGGGTPSYVDSSYIVRTLEIIKENYNVDSSAEISIESNPGTFSTQKLVKYRSAGVNRISIGLQCWQDKLLKSIGRIHSQRDFVEGFYESKRAGFNNINVDLIFGLPNQTIEDWKETLLNVCALQPSHISCYSLGVEKGTVMYKQLKEGIIELDDELDRKMYHRGTAFLNDRRYNQYEISNYSRPGKECRHNLVYWELKDYIGLGLGAHSFLDGVRYKNEEVLKDYIDKIVSGNNIITDRRKVNTVQLKEEFAFLGLRKIKGIDDTDYKLKFNASIFDDYGEVIEKLSREGFIKVKGENISLSRKGLDYGNYVFMSFLKD